MKTPPVLPQRVVGIGASAGGLDALKQLFAQLPIETGLAFVVLQHLPPSQVGKLAAILAKVTAMPVIDVESGQRIEPDRVYVVPPRIAAGLFRGALVLRTPSGGGRPHLPIDGLLGSLAAVLGERAIGVVLSGTASDGTEGLRAIQAAGGLTLVQDPTTAQFDQMPRSAIAAGVAEAVLAPTQIADELGALAKLVAPHARPGPAPRSIDAVLDQLRDASGIDFASYKRTTIERRLARRLAKHGLGSLDEYARYLTEHPAEARAVYEDLLIHVTEFFRDRPALDDLVTHVVPGLARDRAADAAIRVWVPGCASGEEVYTLAMLLLEQLGDRCAIQLFGTDLSERSIEIARAGRYPATIAAQVGPERLARFFSADGSGFQIKRAVRERCVFVRHDLVSDPPFSKLDLVSCRNVLIYLGPSLQKRVIPLFHYALNQPGYLVLGRAESITGFESLFSRIAADAPIFARMPAIGRAGLTLRSTPSHALRSTTETPRTALEIQRDVDHVLLARYGPACVLVDANLDILQFRGRTGPYLEPAPGQPQLNLLRMARDGLASELRLVVQRARRSDAPARTEGIELTEGKHTRQVRIEVVPVRAATDAQRCFVVVFEEAQVVAPGRPARRSKKLPERTETVRLRQELAATREYLMSVVAQHAATSEELGVTNEELQSTNEELQSSNEELQTAKEELQSTNEELETVNEELQRGNQELRRLNDDLANVLASVELAIIIVDTEHRIRRFTPKARMVMKLIAGDVGRPIGDLQPTFAIPELDRAIDEVIASLSPRESEVVHADGTCYRMQIRPYRTTDDTIGGAVIAFADITMLRRSLEETRAARDYANAIVDAVPTPLVVLDRALAVQSANRAFHTLVPGELVGRSVLEVGAWSSDALRVALGRVAETGEPFEDLEIVHRSPAGASTILLAIARVIPSLDGRFLILLGLVDISAPRRAEQEREAFVNAVTHELRTPLSAILLWTRVVRDLERSDPRHGAGIDTIEQSARAEARLVDDLLELALSQRTSVDAASAEALDPAPIIQAAIDDARPDAHDKRIAIEVTLARGIRSRIDGRRMRQIASHLVSNAIKFTPIDGRVWVSLAHSGKSLSLRVRESGTGIPQELLANLFQPFSRADRSLTRTQPGLGIGLALVRQLVERQGGVIELDRGGDGRGATFTVSLPAVHDGAE